MCVCAGNARSMGEALDEFKHQQTRAEKEPTSCAWCTQLVWQLKQGSQGLQVYDHYQDGW